jgi:hypothetical protein
MVMELLRHFVFKHSFCTIVCVYGKYVISISNIFISFMIRRCGPEERHFCRVHSSVLFVPKYRSAVLDVREGCPHAGYRCPPATSEK